MFDNLKEDGDICCRVGLLQPLIEEHFSVVQNMSDEGIVGMQ